jgi:hypothetical protein
MNSYLDQLIDLFLNEEKWDPEAARQKAGNVGMKAGEGRTVSPDIKQSASPTIVGSRGVVQRGSGRGRKKKEAGKINKPLSDSIDRLQHLLETVGDDTTAPPDDVGYYQNPKSQKAAKYTSQLEKIHGYLKDNEESMEDLARKDERAGLRINLLQGIDGVGRSHAILKGIEGVTNSPMIKVGTRKAG